MQLVFVYGTFKPGQVRYGPLEKYCKERKIDLDPKPATTAGLLYALDHGYPGLIRNDTDKAKVVHGYVLYVGGDPAITGVLNSVEGYNPFQKDNTFEPQRMYADVETKGKGIISIACWCYYYHPSVLKEYFMQAKLYKQKKAPQLVENGNWDGKEKYFTTLSGIHEEPFPPKHG